MSVYEEILITHNYLEDGELKWGKWENIHEADEETKKKATHRSIRFDEIVLDIDDEPYKERHDKIIEDLDKKGYFYKSYSTGSRGYHIHLRFEGLEKIREDERKKIKEYFISKYECDLAKAVTKVMIAFEDRPHWKSGKIKTLIKETEEENDLNKLLKEYQDSKKQDNIKKAISSFYDYKDMAEQFYKIQPIYYDKSKLWFLWSYELKKWEIIDETDLFIILDKAIDSGMVNTTKNHIKTEIIECLKREGRKNKPKEPKVEWIQFKNYVYDIYTRKRFEPTPEYFFINPIQWNIGETVDTPVMDKLFKEWVGKDNVEMLYEIIAYSLYRDYPIHRIFCLIGGGRNGKSKYLELINRFIGKENSSSTELDQLILSRFEVAKMYRKLVCMMGETNYTAMEKTALLKKLTGQDLIGYEFKQKNPFDDYNYAKIMIATNSIPITHDKTDGFYRRWLIIDFPNQFEEGKNILDTIPEEEYENLALKSVVILKMLLEEGRFTNELSIEDKKVVYEEKSNPLSLFLKEHTVEQSGTYIKKSEFNAKLLAWLNKNGYRTLNNQEINGLMREKHHDKKAWVEDNERIWVWEDLSWLKKDLDQEDQEDQVI